MQMQQIKIEKVREVKTPTYGSPGSAGLDFYVPSGITVVLEPGASIKIPSGIKVELPADWHLIAFNKSGRALQGLDVGATVVDSDYRGEINLHVHNRSSEDVLIKEGEKLIQFLYMSVPQISIIEGTINNNTQRGQGGFGSTGLS